jgi:hypothetical protein
MFKPNMTPTTLVHDNFIECVRKSRFTSIAYLQKQADAWSGITVLIWKYPNKRTRSEFIFSPNRFPAAHAVTWHFPPFAAVCQFREYTREEESPSPRDAAPAVVVYYNFTAGFIVMHKPSGLPSHATVDNGVENVLYQLEHANPQCLLRRQDKDYKLSLPQRLDIETSGLLLLVATSSQFASYMGRLLQQKSTTDELRHYTEPAITKKYNCLVHIHDVHDRCNLLRLLEQSDGILVHYMDPDSTAPKTFVDDTKHSPPEGWLNCVLRVLDVGPWLVDIGLDIMELTATNE